MVDASNEADDAHVVETVELVNLMQQEKRLIDMDNRLNLFLKEELKKDGYKLEDTYLLENGTRFNNHF